jgi:hypothetical protein
MIVGGPSTRATAPAARRVVIGRGRDASDVAMATTFGGPQLHSMTVHAAESAAMMFRPTADSCAGLDHRTLTSRRCRPGDLPTRAKLRYDYPGPVQQLRHRWSCCRRLDTALSICVRTGSRCRRGRPARGRRDARGNTVAVAPSGSSAACSSGSGPCSSAFSVTARCAGRKRAHGSASAERYPAPRPRPAAAARTGRGSGRRHRYTTRASRPDLSSSALGHHLPVRRHLGTDHGGRRAGRRAGCMPGLGAHHARVVPPARSSRPLRIRAPARPRWYTCLGRSGDTSGGSCSRDAVRPVQRRPSVGSLPDRGYRPRLR